MPYVYDGRTLIDYAFKERFAMPAFNVGTLEMARACVEAAELERAPIILQTSPGELTQASPAVLAGMMRALAEEATVPVMLHLDHGEGPERVAACLRAGYSSVMYDGDHLTLEENIATTRRLAKWAHASGVSLEAAAGSFGAGEGRGERLHLTDPEIALRLLDDGGADMVACSVGSVHGQASRLDLDRLGAIARRTRKPLVLHGGTGIPAEDLAVATTLGVVKVNIGAGLQRAVLKVWRERSEAEGVYEVSDAARAALVEVARDKIRIMKAAGRA